MQRYEQVRPCNTENTNMEAYLRGLEEMQLLNACPSVLNFAFSAIPALLVTTSFSVVLMNCVQLHEAGATASPSALPRK